MRVMPTLARNNHLLSTADLSADELKNILQLMKLLKDAHKQGVQLPLLKDKVLGMIFEISSTRTRISFETAMTELGGHAEFLAMGNLQIGDGHETMRDTAEVISRMTDGVIMRCNDHAYLEEFARFSYVPVFNGMTMDGHPTQALADVFTMMEHLPGTSLNEMTMLYLGDNNDNADKLVPIQRELMWMAAKLGMTYIACGPRDMWPSAADAAQFERFAAENASSPPHLLGRPLRAHCRRGFHRVRLLRVRHARGRSANHRAPHQAVPGLPGEPGARGRGQA